MPGLRQAQEAHGFGITQMTASCCIPAANADIAGMPNCRAINDKVFELARRLHPDIVILNGTFEKYLDHVVETVVALKQMMDVRVIVLGPVPGWNRGLPNEVLRYYMLHHDLIPRRFNGAVSSNWYDAKMRAALVPEGTEFISA
jgi:hypothetical protein